jgi:hypothetical protein
VPVFINCRDRLTPLLPLVEWLERAGCEEIYLLDNDSAYEPLLDYYERTPHTVVRLRENYGAFCLWVAPGVFEFTSGRPFVYTDPDVIPDECCPLDALDRFAALLDRYPAVNKAGFGLRIDDLPDHYLHKDAVREWEKQYWRWKVEDGAYFASIDTTLALYRPGAQQRPAEAIRTGPPYVARHAPWYLDLGSLPDDERFYLSRTVKGHWTRAELPVWLQDALAGIDTPTVSLPRRAVRRMRMFATLHWTLRGRRLLPRRDAQTET